LCRLSGGYPIYPLPNFWLYPPSLGGHILKENENARNKTAYFIGNGLAFPKILRLVAEVKLWEEIF